MPQPAAVDQCRAPDAPTTRFVVAPNGSLSWRQACWFLWGVGSVALGIGVMFAWLGFWVILPFAGLEIAALTAAMYVSVRRNAEREVISVFDDHVLVEVGRTDRPDQRQATRFIRAWTRVRLEPGESRLAPNRLRIGASGRFMTLGKSLTDDERAALAERIRTVLADGVSPPATWSKA